MINWNISKNEIFFNCHSTSTQIGDWKELEAIEKSSFLMSGNNQIDLVALKGYLGHCLSASGIVEFILGMEIFKE